MTAPKATATLTTQPTKTPVVGSDGLTSTDKIGLGIGLGIGLPLLACLAAVIVLLLAKMGKRSANVPQQEQPQLPRYNENEQAMSGKHEIGPNNGFRLSELGDTARRFQTQELDGRRAL